MGRRLDAAQNTGRVGGNLGRLILRLRLFGGVVYCSHPRTNNVAATTNLALRCGVAPHVRAKLNGK
jgi:hypothetical protein